MYNKLREERIRQNKTLEELAKESGVSRQHIAALETNESAVLAAKTKTLKSIADALHSSVTAIFFEAS